MTIELHLAVTNLDGEHEAVFLATYNIDEARRAVGRPWDLPKTSPEYRERTEADNELAVLTLPLEDDAFAATTLGDAIIEVAHSNPNALTVDAVVSSAAELLTQREKEAEDARLDAMRAVIVDDPI